MSLGRVEQRFLLRSALELSAEPGELDWDAVAARARRFWLSGLAWRAAARLPDGGGGGPRRLHRDALQLAAGSALAVNAFVRVTRVLAAAGLECMGLKGAALVAADPGYAPLRAITDVDLLVRPRDVEAVDEALRAAGYRRAARRPTLGGEGELAALAAQPFASGVADYATDTSVPLDLHVRPPARVEGGVDGLFARALTVKLQGADVRIPSVEDQLVIACDHALQHHAGDPRLLPRHLADVAHLLRLGPRGVDGPGRAPASVEASLRMLDEARAVATGGRPAATSRVARAISPTWSGAEGKLRAAAAGVRWSLAFSRRAGWRAVFPTRAYLAASYGVPERTWWLPALHLHRLLRQPLALLGVTRRPSGAPRPPPPGPGA